MRIMFCGILTLVVMLSIVFAYTKATQPQVNTFIERWFGE